MAIFELTAIELLTLSSGIGLIFGLAALVLRSDLSLNAKAGTAIILTLLPWPILRGIFGSLTTTAISFSALGMATLAFLLAESLTDRAIPRPVLFGLVALGTITAHAIVNNPATAEGNEDFLPQLVVFWAAALIAAWALVDVPLSENEPAIKGMILIGLITSVLTVLARDELDQSHIELGRSASFGLLVLMLHTPKNWVPPARWLGMAVLALGAIASGSRAPIIFIAMSALFVTLVKYTMRADIISLTRITLGMITTITVMVVSLPVIVRALRGDSNEASALFIYRQIDLVSVTALLESQSASARTESLFAPAIDLMQTNPIFGSGLLMGVTPDTGIYNYAHNAVLELGAGMGYPGLVLGIVMVGAVALTVTGLAQQGRTLVAGTTLYWLLSAQISGNLPINRFAFLFGVMALVEYSVSRQRAANPVEAEDADSAPGAPDSIDDGSPEGTEDDDSGDATPEGDGDKVNDGEPVGTFLGLLG